MIHNTNTITDQLTSTTTRRETEAPSNILCVCVLALPKHSCFKSHTTSSTSAILPPYLSYTIYTFQTSLAGLQSCNTPFSISQPLPKVGPFCKLPAPPYPPNISFTLKKNLSLRPSIYCKMNFQNNQVHVQTCQQI